ncbi:MAG: SUMF1/EgtB/PvdO family nonheme iron enzyme [Pirellulales bacterium]|nr:SUMF1/EgtB/PvdO family nonheme iron enzyme [Pirellulales bacterium]
MGINVICRCGRQFTVEDDLAGRLGKCPECGQILVVPATSYDVFISHSSHSERDVNTAIAICRTLETGGVRCWIAPRDIDKGKVWAEGIMVGIDACRVLVLVYSARSNESTQVLREVEAADAKCATLLTFCIEDVIMSRSLAFFLQSRQWFKAYTGLLDEHLEELLRTVKSILRRPDETPRLSSPGANYRTATAGSGFRKWTDMPNKRWKYALGGAALIFAMAPLLLLLHGGDPPSAASDEERRNPGAQTTVNQPAPDHPYKGMVHIPPGIVHLGASEERLRAHAKSLASIRDNPRLVEQFVQACRDEKVEVVSLGGFWIDKYEVTNGDYAKFIAAKNHRPPAIWGGTAPPAGREDHPVTGVAYEDAASYAAWVGKQLPTVAQWTRAFRGDDDRIYPWGNAWERQRANTAQNNNYAVGTSPVTASPDDASPFGVCNLVGNVDEIMRERPIRLGHLTTITKGSHSEANGDVYGAAPFEFFVIGEGALGNLTGFRCVIEDR